MFFILKLQEFAPPALTKTLQTVTVQGSPTMIKN
jgi:hypothetical protein